MRDDGHAVGKSMNDEENGHAVEKSMNEGGDGHVSGSDDRSTNEGHFDIRVYRNVIPSDVLHEFWRACVFKPNFRQESFWFPIGEEPRCFTEDIVSEVRRPHCLRFLPFCCSRGP
jgi:hypothetical protein